MNAHRLKLIELALRPLVAGKPGILGIVRRQRQQQVRHIVGRRSGIMVRHTVDPNHRNSPQTRPSLCHIGSFFID
jgi:hypothetical protein